MGAETATTLLLRLLREAVALLPERRSDWGAAVLAESAAVPKGWARARFTAEATLGVLRIVVGDLARGRVANPAVVGAALLVGTAAAVIDLTAGARTYLWLILGVGSLALGLASPRGAWRWGVAVAVVLPLLVMVLGFDGPYAHDPADVWYPLAPCLVLALAGGEMGRRVRWRRRID